MDSPSAKKASGSGVRSSGPAARAGFVWLACLFCLGVGLRLMPRAQSSSVEASLLLPERLVLTARFGDVSQESQRQLLATARSLEAGQLERLSVIDGQPLDTKQLETLPDGYRIMAEYQRQPTAATEAILRQRARDAKQRLALCVALAGGLVTVALGCAFLGKTAPEHTAVPMATLGPVAVLSLFMGWDVAQLFGLGPLLEACGLRKLLAPIAFVVAAQTLVYGFMLLLFRLARRHARAPWNLSYPFPSAWIGRGYFACYALIYPLNLLIGVLSGRSPSSTNPLLEMFMQASAGQVAVLAFLVVIVGPFFEELMFRGWLFGGLRERWGDRRALLMSAALFAVIHGDPWATPALFLLGCVFGWVYLRSGSLWGSIALHAMWNATTFIFLLANMP